MRGLLEHFKLTLLLNFRNRQALIYGYLVPVFFLIAFGSIFRNSSPPLIHQLGQLLTITVLGGACFGMPTAMVAERERGVWRRYRLLPAATGSLVISTMAARYLLVMSAAVMQIVLAALLFGMPMPEHPVQLVAAFSVVTFAFLGMGLVIAMLAEGVPAVQALGQAIFLPMIIIGGVGVPLWTLPTWAQHLAAFLPGKYAVEALDDCISRSGLGNSGFDLLALLAIGAAGCVAGGKMFRWDSKEKGDPRKRGWVLLALGMWLSVGGVAELMMHNKSTASAAGDAAPDPMIASTTTSAPSASVATHSSPGTLPASMPAADDSQYVTITQAQIDTITYNDMPEDSSTITPVAKNLDGLDDAGRARIAEFRKQLDEWEPGKVASLPRRVRNFLDAAAVADLTPDPYEGADAYVIFEKLRKEVPKDELEKVLTWITLHPADADAIVRIPELGITGRGTVRQIQERVEVYAAKLLGRVTGKINSPP